MPAIEAGARAGLIAPDDVTYEYLSRGDRPFTPKGKDWDAALAEWKTLKPAIRQRIRLIANERKLTVDQIAKALTCKDNHLLQFAECHTLSLDWLICGDLRGLQRMLRWQRGVER